MGRDSQILIVDDDAATLDTFARMLSLEGYLVRTAMTAADAWREIEGHSPDAILLDLRMPLVDGLGFLRELRARRFRTPVAIVTGDYFIADTMAAQILELRAELRFKPLWVNDLSALVRGLLASAG